MRLKASSDIPLVPREIGAWVQLGLALVSGLILAQGHPRSWGQAVSTAILFMASEPARRLLARRDPALDPATRLRAFQRLWCLCILASLCFAGAWFNAPAGTLHSLLMPLVLASTMAALIVTQREHSAMGELVASWAFASAAFPIAMLGGASRIHAGLFTLTLVGIQTVGTVTVRAFLESQGKKDRSVLRLFPLLLGLLIMGLGFAGSQSSAKHVALAMIPSTLVAAWMLLAPPSPRRMKHIGWALTLASVAGAALLLFLWA